jgi:glycerol-3-phosphate dehydrogenase (NAD(P)+)
VDTLSPLRELTPDDAIIVNLAKGIDGETGLTAFQTISKLFPAMRKVALSGPSIANEFARCLPTTVVIAGMNDEDLLAVSQLLDNDFFRTRFSRDVILADNSSRLHLANVRGGMKLWRLYEALQVL